MADKQKLITQSAVMELGFTKTMIAKLLPAPVLKKNPFYSGMMKLYDESAVLAVMETDEYKAMREKAEARKASATKAVKTKAEKAQEALNAIVATISVKVISMASLEKRTLDAKQAWYNECGIYEASAAEAPESTRNRWMVNYIRHNLTDYDEDLLDIYGKVGKGSLYEQLKCEVLKKIEDAYPALAEECEEQIRECCNGYYGRIEG